MGANRESAYLHKQAEWKALYEAGESFRSIAKKEGVYFRTVQGVLQGVVEPRPKQQYAKYVDQWVVEYVEQEMSAQDIAQKYGVNGVTVAKYLRAAGVEIRNSRTRVSPFESVIPEWIERYRNGDTLRAIAEDYQVFPQTVHKHIHQKVEMRHYAETSQVHDILNPDYFEVIDSHEKAYWLGIWFGTGFVVTSPLSWECTLVIDESERNTIDRFQAIIGYGRKVQTIKKKNSNVARLRIHNKQFAKIMAHHGLKTEKEDTLEFPDTVPQQFVSSFLLGYSEGKSSCYTQIQRIKDNEYMQLHLYLFGSLSFLTKVQSILLENANAVAPLKVVKKRGANGGVRHELRVTRYRDAERIIEWLYSESPIWSAERDMRKILEVKRRFKH